MKRTALALTLAGTLAATAPARAATQPATPIQSTGPAPTTASHVGHVARPHRIANARPAWQNPFMAPNPGNSVHNDAWQTDAYTQFSGPLGRRPQVLSTGIGRTCITLIFDRRGRLIGSCTNLDQGPALYLLDPVTLDTLAFIQLPYVPPPAGTNPALNTTGGAYFYLDNRGRVVVAASNRHILVVGHRRTPDGPRSSRSPTTTRRRAFRPTSGCPRPSPTPRAACGSSGARTGRSACWTRRRQVRLDRAGRGDRELLRHARDGTYIVSDKAHVQVPRRRGPQAAGASGGRATGTPAG